MLCNVDKDFMMAQHNDGIYAQTRPGALPKRYTSPPFIGRPIYSSLQQLWGCTSDLCKSTRLITDAKRPGRKTEFIILLATPEAVSNAWLIKLVTDVSVK